MSKEYSFSVMPSVSISRSRFARKSQHKTSFDLGQIIPIYVDEVLPGDTRSIDMASIVRMSTPIAPIMDNIYIDYFAFFVPNRIVWDHWKEFMGENSVSAGIPSNTYVIPYLTSEDNSVNFGTISYGHYMGLPAGVDLSSVYEKISCLPFRGLAKIYNRWFRNQNIIAPLAVQTGDTNEVLVGEFSDGYPVFATDSSSVLLASKLPDYFVSSLPYAQKGQAVSIPIGTTAPVGIMTAQTSAQTITDLAYSIGQSTIKASDGFKQVQVGATGGTGLPVWVADLSNATAATINQLRYAFQLQKFLEKDCNGSRYWEILSNHFGIQAPDATLQDPEYLGGFRQNINIDQVLSTAGYSNTSSTTVGAPGANSVTSGKNSIFTKSFVEHGYIFILAVARHDQTYSQGINRMWTRASRYDFYFPVFANLGAQDVKVREIYAQGNATDNTLFGYQEAWAEYRYKPSISSGYLDPNVNNSLDFWTLTNKFASRPTLGQTFIEQGRGNIKRALVTGEDGPDFIADFYFRDIAVRPMPVYSIPGLIDHH